MERKVAPRHCAAFHVYRINHDCVRNLIKFQRNSVIFIKKYLRLFSYQSRISLASFYNKMKDIDMFTFKEITILFSLLKLDDEMKLKLIAT